AAAAAATATAPLTGGPASSQGRWIWRQTGGGPRLESRQRTCGALCGKQSTFTCCSSAALLRRRHTWSSTRAGSRARTWHSGSANGACGLTTCWPRRGPGTSQGPTAGMPRCS
ncbi:hypothetical protein IWQ56_002682, partial [Coemansia nantahalensis]